MTLVDSDEFARRIDVSIFSVSGLQRRVESGGRCHWLCVSSGIAGHGQRLQSQCGAVVYVGLVSVFGSNLNPGENRWVGSTGVVVQEKITEDDNNGDCNHNRPYLRDGARRNTQLALIFRDKTSLTNG